jgi:hypothetical protein
MTEMSCGDYDQKRKDLVVGTHTGRLFSFAVRFISKVPNAQKGAGLPPLLSFQVIHRAKNKVRHLSMAVRIVWAFLRQACLEHIHLAETEPFLVYRPVRSFTEPTYY